MFFVEVSFFFLNNRHSNPIIFFLRSKYASVSIHKTVEEAIPLRACLYTGRARRDAPSREVPLTSQKTMYCRWVQVATNKPNLSCNQNFRKFWREVNRTIRFQKISLEIKDYFGVGNICTFSSHIQTPNISHHHCQTIIRLKNPSFITVEPFFISYRHVYSEFYLTVFLHAKVK